MIEADQVLRDVNRAVLGQPMPSDCILKVEVELEAVGAAVPGEAFLAELDRIEGVAESEVFLPFTSHPGHDPLCVDGCPDEETTRFESAGDVMQECSYFGLGFKQIVHGELAADNVEDDLLLHIPHGLMRSQHVIDQRVGVARVSHYKHGGKLNTAQLFKPFNGLIDKCLLIFERHVMRRLPILMFIEPLPEVAALARAQIEHARQVLETQLVDILVDQYCLDPVVELPQHDDVRKLPQQLVFLLQLVVVENVLTRHQNRSRSVNLQFLDILTILFVARD